MELILYTLQGTQKTFPHIIDLNHDLGFRTSSSTTLTSNTLLKIVEPQTNVTAIREEVEAAIPSSPIPKIISQVMADNVDFRNGNLEMK